MRTFLAVVGAAAMVVASLVIRSRLDAGEGGTPTPTDDVRITCATELAAACEALGNGVLTTVEPAGTTAGRLAGLAAGADPGLDGWLVPNPWPEIVNERRRTRALPPLLGVEGRPVVRSPLRLAVSRPRAPALAPKCPGTIAWKCLGEAAADGYWAAAGRPEWGAIKLGHGEPHIDAVGLLVLGQAVSGYFGRSDLSTIDLEADDNFLRWFSALGRQMRAPSPGGSPLNQMLIIGPAAYDAVGTTDAELASLKVPAGDARVDLLYPEPMATADAVLATAGTTAAKAARSVGAGDAVRKPLVNAGWQAPSSSGLPPTNGLPSGGLLLQLQDRWRGVTGR